MLHLTDSFRISAEFISNNHINVGTDVLPNVLRKRSRFDIFGTEETKIAATLPDADYDLLVVQFGCASLAAILAAYVCLIHFNRSIEHGAIRFHHRSTNPMAEIPCRLVADSQRPFHLISGHSLPRFHKKEHRKKPRFKWQVRIVENCLSRDAELVVTFGALEFLLCSYLEYGAALATQTLNAKRPAESLKQFPAAIIGSKHSVYINQGHG